MFLGHRTVLHPDYGGSYVNILYIYITIHQAIHQKEKVNFTV